MRFAFWIPIIYWFLMNLANIFDAAGDAVGKRGKWILSKTYQTLMILCYWTMVPLVIYLLPEFIDWKHWTKFALMFVFIRIGVFNAAWGLFRFHHCYWWYLGETSLYDKTILWFLEKTGFPEKTFLRLYYGILWVVSIGVLIQGFYVIPE